MLRGVKVPEKGRKVLLEIQKGVALHSRWKNGGGEPPKSSLKVWKQQHVGASVVRVYRKGKSSEQHSILTR